MLLSVPGLALGLALALALTQALALGLGLGLALAQRPSRAPLTALRSCPRTSVLYTRFWYRFQQTLCLSPLLLCLCPLPALLLRDETDVYKVLP